MKGNTTYGIKMESEKKRESEIDGWKMKGRAMKTKNDTDKTL